MRIPTTIVAAAVPLALLAAACGDDGDAASSGDDRAEQTTTEPASADHNEADVEFALMMIPHHRGAVDMAALAPDRAEAPEILDLAERIQAAQDPEIEQMTDWLEEWGEDVPAEDDAGHDMGGDSTTSSRDMGAGGSETGHGMMSADDMATLEAASGAEFDRAFAEMMIVHHQGAIDMADDEIVDGRFPEAIDLAHAIVAAQEAEITEMQGFLDQSR